MSANLVQADLGLRHVLLKDFTAGKLLNGIDGFKKATADGENSTSLVGIHKLSSMC